MIYGSFAKKTFSEKKKPLALVHRVIFVLCEKADRLKYGDVVFLSGELWKTLIY
jgi:hypothetical protein